MMIRVDGSGYSIYTREQKKTFQLSERTILGSTGCVGATGWVE